MNINDLLNTTGVTSQPTNVAKNPTSTPQPQSQQPIPTDPVTSQPQTPPQPNEKESIEEVDSKEKDIKIDVPLLPPLEDTDNTKDLTTPRPQTTIPSNEPEKVITNTDISLPPLEKTNKKEEVTPQENDTKVDVPPLPPLEKADDVKDSTIPQPEIESLPQPIEMDINNESTKDVTTTAPTADLTPPLPNIQENNTNIPNENIVGPTAQPSTPTAGAGALSLENMQSQIVSGNNVLESSDMLNATSSAYPYTMKQLLEIVVQKNASDLHIGANYPALIRIDGELQPVGTQIITPEIAKDLIFSILSEENKEVAEINKEVDIAYAYEDIARFRVNVYHSTGSMSAALRLIPNKIKTMEELNLPKIYQNFVNLKQGLILVTGPTGHGKSTTLAAILNEINKSKPLHIITIEDPVEYVYPVGKALVNQREMKQDTHSWDIALKSILREDPDVVLVGEMRDYETISAAITIAETGHLVFATLHTNSASQTIDRIIDVFPEHQQGQIRTQLAVVIEGIIAQRLVKLNGGGRRAVSEVMMGTAAVRNIIREGKTYQLDNVIRTSGDVGMISIERSLVDLVREGLISVEDAQLNAINPEEVLRLLK